MHRAAVIVSAVFHPLLMPLASVYVATKFDWFIRGQLWPEQARLVYLVVALSTIVFPGINILLLRWHGALSSLERPPQKERLAPFLSTLFFFGTGYYLLSRVDLPDAIYSILLGSGITLIVLSLLNFIRKISVHSAGAFGLVGTILGLFHIHSFANLELLAVAIFIGAGVVSSRLILRAHTPTEAYTGAIAGFLCMFLTVFLELKI